MMGKRRSWLILAGLFIVTAALAFGWLFPRLRKDNSEVARETVQELYEGVKDGARANPELDAMDGRFGPVMMFQIERVECGLVGKPLDVFLMVTRRRNRTEEVVHLSGAHDIDTVRISKIVP